MQYDELVEQITNGLFTTQTIEHHGVVGMKWGVRKDDKRRSGSIQNLISNRKREKQRKGQRASASYARNIKTQKANRAAYTKEIEDRIKVLRLEREYKTMKNARKSVVDRVLVNSISNSFEQSIKAVLTPMLTYGGKQAVRKLPGMNDQLFKDMFTNNQSKKSKEEEN